MKVLKTIGNVSFVLLAAISVLIMITYGFYSYFVDDVTVGINNVADQIAVDVKAADDLSADEISEYEERWFMEANYYSNAKNNGFMLQELEFNYFTTYELTQDGYRATGMQYKGDFKSYMADNGTDARVVSDFYYYDTIDGISYNGYAGTRTQSVSTLLNREAQFIIKIDDRPFMIQLTGKYVEENYFLWFDRDITYDYGDLFECVMKAIKSNSAGYGDYYITLDLSSFFSIKEMDIATGKFVADNVTDIIKNYAVIKFHYDENGASRSSQSMFGRIENNAVVGEYSAEYWQERMVYTLTEKDLTYRYSDSYDGYFVSLNLETKKLFDEMPRVKLLLTLDLSSIWMEEKEYNVVGFDYNAFAGFEIDTLTVQGSPRTIFVLNDAFKDCSVGTLLHSEGMIFDGLFLEDTEVKAL